MAKTADFAQSVWSDPWFVALSVDAKLLYVWSFTNEHSNMAGLYVVARPLIEMETGIRGRRLGAAFEATREKLLYHEDTGTVWVVGRANHVRNRTVQIGKSIANAVKACPHAPFRDAFIHKHRSNEWITRSLGELQLNFTGNGSVEPESVNFTRTSPEVPSQSQSQSQKKNSNAREQVDQDALAIERLGKDPRFGDGARSLVEAVHARLTAVAERKPGAVTPSIAAVAKALGDFPAKDFIPAAGNFGHHWLHGVASNKSLRDVVRAYRNWLQNEPDVSRRTSTAARTRRDYTTERIAEAEK